MKPIKPSILQRDPLLRRVWDQMGQPPGCRVIGGYVRDRLLGRRSNDLDLTMEGNTDKVARPAKRLAAALGVRAHLLGTVPHRIWRIETDGLKIELWPMGGLTHEEDMARRDFSCNALSWELPDGPLVDLVGGLDDLKAGRLRTISRMNLHDDPIRMIRAPRFLAQLPAFELDDQTRSWIRDLAPTLAKAPRERVGQELLTLLRAPAAARGLLECLDLGLFEHAAPVGIDFDERWLQRHLDASNALNSRPIADNAARLAFLFRAWGPPKDSVLAPYAWLKADRDIALRAAHFLDDAAVTVDASPADRREFAWRAGPAFPSLITLAAALAPDLPGWARWRRQWLRDPSLTHPTPLLSGDEISATTCIDPGPELGTVADALLRAQVRGEVRSRGGALRWLMRRRAPG